MMMVVMIDQDVDDGDDVLHVKLCQCYALSDPM